MSELAAYYSLDDVLAMIPMEKSALKRIACNGDFVPRLKIGKRWFFKQDDVNRFIEENTIADTPEESNRTWREIEQEARRRSERKTCST